MALKETIKFFFFHDALLLLPQSKKLISNFKNMDISLNYEFIKVLKTYPNELSTLQPIAKVKLLVIQKIKSNGYQLLYDGRHFLNVQQNWPLEAWILDNNGNLLRKTKKIQSLPKLSKKLLYRKHDEEIPLWQLLDLQHQECDPQNQKDTVNFLTKFKKEDCTQIHFLFSPPKKYEVWHINYSTNNNVVIEAFTKSDYSIAFRKKISKVIKEDKCTTEEKTAELTNIDKNQSNRSAAVSVKMSGLNQAYNLGCLTLDELKSLSKQLSSTAGSIWMELDNKHNARYVTYRDVKFFIQFELKDFSSWTKLFDIVFKRKAFFTNIKQTILGPLLQHLRQFSSKNQSPFNQCIKDFETCIKNFQVVVYSKNDSSIHAIKLQLAHYIKTITSKRRFSLSLTKNAKNDLLAIKNADLTVFNLNAFLSDNVIPEDLLQNLNIKSSVKKLFHQDKQSGITMIKHCQQRGESITRHLLTQWQNIGLDFLYMFDFDIFSSPFKSLSYLSFQTIWSKYTQQGGIYHHGLEKTKPYYEDILRNHSHGGYFYSCQDKLDVDQPLHGFTGNPASSIMELDITSSYGYATSNMMIPSGFCYGYIANDEGILVRCDKIQRHKTFEFLSVFYTLHVLEKQGFDIQTVYSNFHQYGIFYINKYPVDLVVICKKQQLPGQILLFQFDGQYAHGCRQKCQPLTSYVQNQTQEQLEHLTQNRDYRLQEWCLYINTKTNQNHYATYHIKTDCHDPDYKVKTMLNYFNTEPKLAPLIKGYLNASQIDIQDVVHCNNDLTYIADIEGYVLSNPDLKPLFIQNEEHLWNRHSKTTSSILLTKDYINYLKKEYNFQITSIKSVLFYKNCNILNQIYKQLVLLRQDPNISLGKKQLLKNIVNYSAGFFGFNQNKPSTVTNKIVSDLTDKYNISNQETTFIGSVENINYYLKTTTRLLDSSKKRKSSISPLPLYVAIVEYGKMRMSQMLCLLDYYIDPVNYRHLYSNIDNIIIALAHPTFAECIKPEFKKEFQILQQQFFMPNEPGHFKEEFCFTKDQQWKFVSPRMQIYALLTNETINSVHKNSALNHLSSQESYDYSVKLLNEELLNIKQIRRTNKMLNMDTHEQNFIFNNK